MFSEEMKSLLVQVISSWQVLATTGVLIVYVFLVNYVARIYHRRRPPQQTPIPETPEKPAAAAEAGEPGIEEESFDEK